MKIRYAEVFDAFSITKIQSDGWQKTYTGMLPDVILQKRAFSQERVLRWENRLKERQHIVLVSENEKGIVTGFVWGGIGTDARILIKHELYALYVDDREQNRGYGSALLAAFAKEVQDDFYLFALRGNEKARNFYLRKGGVLKQEFAKKQEDDGFFLQEECFCFKTDNF